MSTDHNIFVDYINKLHTTANYTAFRKHKNIDRNFIRTTSEDAHFNIEFEKS